MIPSSIKAPAPRVLHLDFETASGVDLKAVGVENYVRHRDFAVTAIAWAFGNDAVQSRHWPLNALPDEVRDHIMNGGTVNAWNAAFEWNVLLHAYNLNVPHEQMDCVMQRASAWGLPMSLQDAGDALNLPIVKDKLARPLMLSMGKPKKDGTYWHLDTSPAAVAKLVSLAAYCVGDVEAERALDKVVPPLAKFEKKLSIADAKINQIGVKVDGAAVVALRTAVTIEKGKIDAECAALTGGAVTSPGTQTAMMLAWLQSRGCTMGGLTKADVSAALRRKLVFPEVRRVLELRQQAARASVAKLDRMYGWASTHDGRARNLLQFYGAGRTGRWAGRGIQVQNLPRPTKGLKPDTIIKIAEVDPGALGLFGADPLAAISGALRGCLVPRENHKLVSIDFSQIEARVLAWLAGQLNVVHAFATNLDVYTIQAGAVGSTDRQLGKVLVLACGYGMGWSKFQETARDQYGLELSDGEAQQAHRDWRQNNRKIVGFWYDLEGIVVSAVNHPGQEHWLGGKVEGLGVAARMQGGVLQIRKPNGVKLSYHNMRWYEGDLVFDGVDPKTKQWMTQKTYGGKLVENLVQSVARDVMAEGILGAPKLLPVMTIHDEIVWEVEAQRADDAARSLQIVVETIPTWAPGLPLASDVKILSRYGK